jgi:hypothetical protein
MKKFTAFVAVSLPVALLAFKPEVDFSVSPDRIVLTETAEAAIGVSLPQRLPAVPSFSANFIPEGSRFQVECRQVRADDSVVWRYSIKVPVAGEEAGVRKLGPVTVRIPVSTGFFGMVSRYAELKSSAVELTVLAPPVEGRPASYCGAIAKDFAVSASVDSNVCTSGDPLLFTLELSGAADASMVYAPPVANAFKGTQFKLDEASLKTETLAASKRFTWRVRAVGAGTVELPSVSVAWYDLKSRSYKTQQTVPIPVQIKAGEQATLGGVDEIGGETDEFPMPDGIEIPFVPANFTLKHALSLAVRANNEKEFATAAERYAAFVEMLDAGGEMAEEDGLAFKAVHLRNLASLFVMGGRPREAIAAYSKSELISGATPATVRGLKAAYARLKNDPRCDLPLPRILFPFWFRFALAGRILSVVGAAALFALLFILAVKAGRRLAVFAFMCTVAYCAQAWPFGGRSPFSDIFDDMPSVRMGFGGNVCPVGVDACFSNEVTMIGEPVHLIVRLKPGTVHIAEGSVNLEASLPPTSVHDGLQCISAEEYRVRTVFLEPGTNDVRIAVSGAYSGTYTVTNGNMISSGRVVNQPFKVEPSPVRIVVKPLPEKGRPLDYTGAVGRNFRITQKLTPDKVHPGDLVAAEYRLEFEGYCPSNATVRLDNLSREFKAYEMKEIFRDSSSVVWRQMIVPRTTEATNSALVSFSYYDLRAKRYARAKADPAKVVFVSNSKASTENRSVSVTDVQTGAFGVKAGEGKSLVLRFAPHENSPVVISLPPGAEVRETCRMGEWRRMESARGAGWSR